MRHIIKAHWLVVYTFYKYRLFWAPQFSPCIVGRGELGEVGLKVWQIHGKCLVTSPAVPRTTTTTCYLS
jgi:hypothetical protein